LYIFGGGINLQKLKKKSMIKKNYIINRTEILETFEGHSFFNLGDIPQTPNSYFQMLKNQKKISQHVSVSWLFLFFSKTKIF